MCFSATASFSAGALLLGLGTLTLRSARCPRELSEVRHDAGTATRMTSHYVWLVWSSAFLLPWVLLYALFPQHRVAMWWASVFLALFGLTEPIFVPRYWNPPSLFELAQRTSFDIESIIFSFAIGGIGAVLYNSIARKRLTGVELQERRGRRHGCPWRTYE